MKKILSIAITLFLLIGFSSTAWCSVVGDWDMVGKMSVKIKIEGEGSENIKGYVYDEFTFYPGGDFEMIDAEGTWTQTKKKFIILLNRDSLEEYYEAMIYRALGVDVDVTVIMATMTGTENIKTDSIKAKFKFRMTFENAFYDLYGTIQASANLKGTRSVGFASIPAEQGDPSQLKNALLEAVQGAIESATLGRK